MVSDKMKNLLSKSKRLSTQERNIQFNLNSSEYNSESMFLMDFFDTTDVFELTIRIMDGMERLYFSSFLSILEKVYGDELEYTIHKNMYRPKNLVEKNERLDNQYKDIRNIQTKDHKSIYDYGKLRYNILVRFFPKGDKSHYIMCTSFVAYLEDGDVQDYSLATSHISAFVPYGTDIEEDVNKIYAELPKHVIPRISKSTEILSIHENSSGLYLHSYSVGETNIKDIDLHYNGNNGVPFSEVDKYIQHSLEHDEHGLYLFRGSTGTGKTTYINYLMSQMKQLRFVKMPIKFLHNIEDPNIEPFLLQNCSNSIFIVEEAESALIKRENSNNPSLVSSLLNLADGVMRQVSKIRVIATTNMDINDIDDAILRGGRLKVDYLFDKLPVDKANKLAKKIGLDETFSEPVSIGNIYHKKDQILKRDKVKFIGFKN